MTAQHGRRLNDAVTQMWGFLSSIMTLLPSAEGLPPATRCGAIKRSRTHKSSKIAGIAFSVALEFSLPESSGTPSGTSYGVDMSEGMLDKARSESNGVTWLRGLPNRLPFEDQLRTRLSTTAFISSIQPAALREFHRVPPPAAWWSSPPSPPADPVSRCRPATCASRSTTATTDEVPRAVQMPVRRSPPSIKSAAVVG